MVDVGTVLTVVVVLADARSEARRWVERLAGQVLALNNADEASKQSVADASELYPAAGSQMDQADSVVQARQVTATAYEGLYYLRAAGTAMRLDPGPEPPPLPGQQRAGSVTEVRDVEVAGHPSRRTSHCNPRGTVAGRPVPQGWYSEPWWRPVLIGGPEGWARRLRPRSTPAGPGCVMSRSSPGS